MDSTKTHWPIWMDSLRRQNLDGLVIWLLEAAAPLHIITAQLLYIGQPLASPQAGLQMKAIARLLEQGDEAQTFAAYLKGQQQ
ncbi:MAG: hypothetical protein Fur0016_16200 [Anaerolineales bacterium]